MASGVKVNDEVAAVFKQVKMNLKQSVKRKFTVLKIDKGDTEIVVDDCIQEAAVEGKVANLLQALPQDDGRYVIYDYDYTTAQGSPASKLIMLSWCPECMTTKRKMLYASSKEALKKKLSDDIVEFHCDGPDEVTDKEILDKVRKF